MELRPRIVSMLLLIAQTATALAAPNLDLTSEYRTEVAPALGALAPAGRLAIQSTSILCDPKSDAGCSGLITLLGNRNRSNGGGVLEWVPRVDTPIGACLKQGRGAEDLLSRDLDLAHVEQDLRQRTGVQTRAPLSSCLEGSLSKAEKAAAITTYYTGAEKARLLGRAALEGIATSDYLLGDPALSKLGAKACEDANGLPGFGPACRTLQGPCNANPDPAKREQAFAQLSQTTLQAYIYRNQLRKKLAQEEAALAHATPSKSARDGPYDPSRFQGGPSSLAPKQAEELSRTQEKVTLYRQLISEVETQSPILVNDTVFNKRMEELLDARPWYERKAVFSSDDLSPEQNLKIRNQSISSTERGEDPRVVRARAEYLARDPEADTTAALFPLVQQALRSQLSSSRDALVAKLPELRLVGDCFNRSGSPPPSQCGAERLARTLQAAQSIPGALPPDKDPARDAGQSLSANPFSSPKAPSASAVDYRKPGACFWDRYEFERNLRGQVKSFGLDLAVTAAITVATFGAGAAPALTRFLPGAARAIVAVRNVRGLATAARIGAEATSLVSGTYTSAYGVSEALDQCKTELQQLWGKSLRTQGPVSCPQDSQELQIVSSRSQSCAINLVSATIGLGGVGVGAVKLGRRLAKLGETAGTARAAARVENPTRAHEEPLGGQATHVGNAPESAVDLARYEDSAKSADQAFTKKTLQKHSNQTPFVEDPEIIAPQDPVVPFEDPPGDPGSVSTVYAVKLHMRGKQGPEVGGRFIYFLRPLSARSPDGVARKAIAASRVAEEYGKPRLFAKTRVARLTNSEDGRTYLGALSDQAEGVQGTRLVGDAGDLVPKARVGAVIPPVAEEDLADARIYSYLVGDADAHPGNYFFNSENRIQFFDASQMFSAAPRKEPFPFHFGLGDGIPPLNARQREGIERVLGSMAQLEREGLVSSLERAALESRARSLLGRL